MRWVGFLWVLAVVDPEGLPQVSFQRSKVAPTLGSSPLFRELFQEPPFQERLLREPLTCRHGTTGGRKPVERNPT